MEQTLHYQETHEPHYSPEYRINLNLNFNLKTFEHMDRSFEK